MMQQYDYSEAEACQPSTDMEVHPSEQAVKTVLAFARSYQVVEVDGMRIEVYLN